MAQALTGLPLPGRRKGPEAVFDLTRKQSSWFYFNNSLVSLLMFTFETIVNYLELLK